MSQNQILVGTQSRSTGLVTQRSGTNADAAVSKYGLDYYLQADEEKMFFGANQAVVTTTVGLATTYTGLVLSNPVTSTVKLVLVRATIMQSVLQSTQTEAFAIAVGFNSTTNVTHTTPVATACTKIGSGTSSIGLCDSAATLPTAPTYHAFVCNTGSVATNIPQSTFEFDGSVILLPGAYMAWVTPAQASVNGMWFNFKWTEEPI